MGTGLLTTETESIPWKSVLYCSIALGSAGQTLFEAGRISKSPEVVLARLTTTHIVQLYDPGSGNGVNKYIKYHTWSHLTIHSSLNPSLSTTPYPTASLGLQSILTTWSNRFPPLRFPSSGQTNKPMWTRFGCPKKEEAPEG